MATTHPTHIGRFEILRELGSGAMGTVYLARDSGIGRLVALKTFRAGPGADPQDLAMLRKRLLREAQSAGMLSHPNVVTIYDIVDEEDGSGFFIVMEYVEGKSLEARIAGGRTLAAPEAVRIARQISSALEHLHSRGIVHRDIKPGNILITDGDVVKITDFGVAVPDDPTRTQETAVFGTPQYMAPEQIQGLDVDPRTDVFAVGVLLYEMLTGHKPFSGGTITEVTHNILYGEPVAAERYVPDLSLALRGLLRRALAKEPAERYGSASALSEALLQASRGLPGDAAPELDTAETEALPGSGWQSPGIWLRRGARSARRRWMTLLAIALAIAGGFAAGAWLLAGPPLPWDRPDDRQAAREEAYLKLVAQGQMMMAQGDPQAAAILFQAAEGFASDPVEARHLRAVAEARAEREGVELGIEEARRALEEGRYGEVIATARRLLGTRAGRDEALQVLGEVETAMSQSTGSPAPQPAPVELQPAAPPASDEPAAVPPAEPLPPQTVRLRLHLESRAAQGVVALWADQRQVLLEKFSFFERDSIFWRRATSGSLDREVEVPASTSTVRVLVARHEEPAKLVTLQPQVEPGGIVGIAVQVPRTGEPRVELETF